MGKRRDRRHQAASGGGGRRMKLDLWDHEAPPAKPAGDSLRPLPRPGEAGEAKEERPAAAKAASGAGTANPLALLDQYSDEEEAEEEENEKEGGRTEIGSAAARRMGGKGQMDDEVLNLMAELEESGLLQELGAGEVPGGEAAPEAGAGQKATAAAEGSTHKGPVSASAEQVPAGTEPEASGQASMDSAELGLAREAPAVHLQVAPEWEAVVDAGSGEVYYWNVITGETSWDKPAGFSSPGPAEQGHLIGQSGRGGTEATDDVRPEAAIEDVAAAAAAADKVAVDAELEAEDDAPGGKAQLDQIPLSEGLSAEREDAAGEGGSAREPPENLGAPSRHEDGEAAEVAVREDGGKGSAVEEPTMEPRQQDDPASSSSSGDDSLFSCHALNDERGEGRDEAEADSHEQPGTIETGTEEKEERGQGGDVGMGAVPPEDETGHPSEEAVEPADAVAALVDRWERVAERLRRAAGDSFHSVPMRVRAALEAELRAADCRAVVGQSRPGEVLWANCTCQLARLEATAGVEEAAAEAEEERRRKAAALAEEARRAVSPSPATPSSSTGTPPSQPMASKGAADLGRLTAYSDSSAEDGEIRPLDEGDGGQSALKEVEERGEGVALWERGNGAELEEGELDEDMEVDMEVEMEEVVDRGAKPGLFPVSVPAAGLGLPSGFPPHPPAVFPSSGGAPPMAALAPSLLQPMQSYPGVLAPSDWAPPPPPPEEECPPAPPLDDAPPPPPPEDPTLTLTLTPAPHPPPPPEPEPELDPRLGAGPEAPLEAWDTPGGEKEAEPAPAAPAAPGPVVYAAPPSKAARPPALENGAAPAVRVAAAAAVPPGGTRRSDPVKKRKAATAAVGGGLRANKRMSSMLTKWKAVKEELHEAEQEADEFDLEGQERRRLRELEEWKSQQLAAGGAAENANFQPLGSDWRDRVRRGKQPAAAGDAPGNAGTASQSAAATSSAAPPSGEAEAAPKADLVSLSKGLPLGWKAFWDQDSGEVYYGNLTTQETTWDRPR